MTDWFDKQVQLMIPGCVPFRCESFVHAGTPKWSEPLLMVLVFSIMSSQTGAMAEVHYRATWGGKDLITFWSDIISGSLQASCSQQSKLYVRIKETFYYPDVRTFLEVLAAHRGHDDACGPSSWGDNTSSTGLNRWDTHSQSGEFPPSSCAALCGRSVSWGQSHCSEYFISSR